ncbi:hypothetical protein FHETE_6761 [Fusarium heterosporum]|uniref:Uncharacterized protein n=1 Tax=Fusarium heterosporum TaxID=42747 RepID=A0A8H5T9L6_FUSHE|nr:hypothetical protein FHETE_6761 [Fusarium heterosporum]
MAGPLQVGDIINLGRLAWDIYRFGWAEDHNATRQYAEFGRDVRGLAENLDILNRVVVCADNSLQSQRRPGVSAKLRWDRTSLVEIIGDYEMTLRECDQLLRSNNRYRVGSNPLRNLEWNVLVQPRADQLRQKIMLHNSKILHFLKPFEVDLLLRVRQDIEFMHRDLADRITAAHHDIRRLMGVLIPDLDEALDQRVQRSAVLLEVPVDLNDQFRFAALTGHPEYRIEDDFELSELSDAFILNFNKSTVNFESGMLVEDRMPSNEQYVNLLKCVWIFRMIQTCPALRVADKDTSHWPSYVRQLEDDLSSQCARFGRELVTPRVITSTLRRDVFTIWPEKEPPPLVDVVTKDEMMEQLLEVTLQSYNAGVEKKAKLLRRLDADGRRFRIIMSGSTQPVSGKLRQKTEIIDFDVTSMVFNPQYALPSGSHMAQEIILRQNERIARLDFLDGGDILKFQQAITGFKPWASVTQYDCQVIFVLGGVKETIMENACLQLWIPKATEGSLVTNSDAAANVIKSPSSSRQNSISTLASGAIPSSPLSGGRSFASSGPILTSNGSNGGGLSASPPGRHPSLPTIPQRQATGPMFYGSWPERSSPEPIGSSPIERQTHIPIPGPPRQFPPRKPVGQPPSPRRSGSLLPAVSTSTTTTKNGRSFSISSGISSNSNSSNSDVRSVSISTGTNSTGLLHKRPVKPMLVAFTQSRQGDRFSFVSIQIDDETNMNPERCNCRRSGRDGASCDIAAIEKKKGDAPLAARRYEQSASDGEMDWNLARLALNNPASTSDSVNWSNLKRLSIKFPTAQARARFCGTPNVCHCKIKKEGDLLKCIQERHRGLWGEVQENYRRQMNSFHKQRYESRSHVVYGVTN